MKKLFLFLCLLPVFSCHKPNGLDHEVATGKIIRKVTSKENSSTGCWLVQFVPTKVSDTKHEIPLNSDSRIYTNVVLADFNFQAEYADTSVIYVLNFNLKDELDRECQVSPDQSASIPSIAIKSITFTDANNNT